MDAQMLSSDFDRSNRPVNSSCKILDRGIWFLSLCAIVIIGILLRIFVAVFAFYPTIDTSTVGVMANDILSGRKFPLFYYGQNYMGAGEAYVASLLFLIFGHSVEVLAIAAIIFAGVWISGSYFSFKFLLNNQRAGIVAAIVTAITPWYIMWYTTATYGGYSLFLACGVWFLGLSLKYPELVDIKNKIILSVLMGLLAGIGIWTNLQVLPYLITGTSCILLKVLEYKRDRIVGYIIPLVTGGIIGVCGLIPYFFSGFYISGWNIDSSNSKHVSKIFKMLWLNCRESMDFYLPLKFIDVVRLFPLFLVLLLTVYVIFRTKEIRRVIIVMLLFFITFITLYLLHPLNKVHAPRYVIPLMTVFFCFIFSTAVQVKGVYLRLFALCSIMLWCGGNLYKVISACGNNVYKKKLAVLKSQDLIKNAGKEGIKNAFVIDSPVLSLQGQVFSFFATNRIHFVSTFYERCNEWLEECLLDDNAGFVIAHQHADKLIRSLNVAGIKEYKVIYGPWTIIKDIKPEIKSSCAIPIPSGGVKIVSGNVTGNASYVTDFDADTTLRWNYPDMAELEFDLGKEYKLHSILVMGGKDTKHLPDSYTVSLSFDGVEYKPVVSEKELLPVFISGKKVMVMGYYCCYTIAMKGETAKSVRINMGRSSRFSEVCEIIFLEEREENILLNDEEAREIYVYAKEKGIKFIASDIWLSSQFLRLRREGVDGADFYLYFNPRYKPSIVSRTMKLLEGYAFALENSLATSIESFFDMTGQNIDVVKFNCYTLFIPRCPFKEELAIRWNGFIPLKTRLIGSTAKYERILE